MAKLLFRADNGKIRRVSNARNPAAKRRRKLRRKERSRAR